MRRGVALAAALGVLGALGCDAEEQPTTLRSDGADAVEPVPPDEAIERPAAPVRGTMVGGQTMQRVIAWPDADTRDTVLYAALRSTTQDAVDSAPVPVLVPADDALAASAQLHLGTHWAALSAQRDGLTVSVQMSAQAKVYPHIKPTPGTHDVRGVKGFVTHNEGVWVVSWIEHGAAYNLELECASLQAAECQDESAVRALAEGLRFVGGRGEGAQ